jgi:hypothetical protein
MICRAKRKRAHGADLYAKSRDPRGREKTVIDSAMGRKGANSRRGPRIDVHEDTAKLLEDLMKTHPVLGSLSCLVLHLAGQKNSPSRSGLRNGLRIW